MPGFHTEVEEKGLVSMIFRHSFAVHILNKWSSEGKDIYTCLPILRTALGHDRITTTEKYLRLVPEAYMEVTEPFNDRFHTITEVLCNEE